jgi:ribosome-binding factor A
MNLRLKKINALLQEEISKILLKEVDFEDCIVTVTKAETVPNFSRSDIFITVMPDKKEKEALRQIKNNIYEVQKILNKKLNMKYVPKICFKIDKGAKNLYKIDKFCK